MGDVETRDIPPEVTGTPEAKDEARERIIKELVEFWNGLPKDDFRVLGMDAAKKLRAKGWIVSGWPGGSSYFAKHPDYEQGFLVPLINSWVKHTTATAYKAYDQNTGRLMPSSELGQSAVTRLRRPAILNPEISKHFSEDCESWDSERASFKIGLSLSHPVNELGVRIYEPGEIEVTQY